MSRRTLAVSVVATISLAEFACAATRGSAAPPLETRNPPRLESDAGSQVVEGEGPDEDEVEAEGTGEGTGEGEGTAEGEEGGPPVDAANADGHAVNAKTTIQQRDDGTCVEMIVAMNCPKGAICNPPPPKPVPCPGPGGA